MMDQEEYLRQFRPYCLMLTTQTSMEVLIKLQLCDETSPTKLQNLQDSINFPMQINQKTATLLERIFSSVSAHVWICWSPPAGPVS